MIPTVLFSIFFVCYVVLSIVTFISVNKQLPWDGQPVLTWRQNYEQGC